MTAPAASIDRLKPLVLRLPHKTHWIKTPTGPKHRKSALTKTILAAHLNGGPGCGCALIEPGTSVTMAGVLDFDSHKGELDWSFMTNVAAAVACWLELRGFPAHVFRSSGGAGIHVYLLWEHPQDAYSVRALLREALASVELEDGTGGVLKGQCEVFPKQDKVPADGFGSMVVLPLAGKSNPLEMPLLNDLPREAELEWRFAAPAPLVEKPVVIKNITNLELDTNLKQTRDALAALPNADLDYSDYRDIIFAIHAAGGGSDEALALANEWSARSAKHVEGFIESKIWPYARSDRGDGITVRTLLAAARAAGWNDASADGFVDLTGGAGVAAGAGGGVAGGGAGALVASAGTAPPTAARPNFAINGVGQILASLGNLELALRASVGLDWMIGFDRFRDEIMVSADEGATWRQFGDEDYTRLRIAYEGLGFKPIGRELIRDAVRLVAKDCCFDSAIMWLRSLVWDGVPRVERFLEDQFGAVGGTYVRAVSRYMWTAMAGRVLEPGCQADMMPILLGPQGVLKSSAVAAMVPSAEHFVEMTFDAGDTDQARLMRGRLVAEIGELRGLESRDLETIKAFVSRRHENWIPKYQEFATTFPRRLIFIGTTNKKIFLSDETGNRRWLPVKVTGARPAEVRAVAAQLWAEAAALFTAGGVDWREAQILAIDTHEEHMHHDVWETDVARWLAGSGDEMTPPVDVSCGLVMRDVFAQALNRSAERVSKGDQMRLGRVLEMLGFERRKTRAGGGTEWRWLKIM